MIACNSNGEEYCAALYQPMPEICNGLVDDYVTHWTPDLYVCAAGALLHRRR